MGKTRGPYNKGKSYRKQRATKAAMQSNQATNSNQSQQLRRGLDNFLARGTVREHIESEKERIDRIWREVRERDGNYIGRSVRSHDEDRHDNLANIAADETEENHAIDNSSSEEEEEFQDEEGGQGTKSTMQKFLEAVRDRIKEECKMEANAEKDKWLFRYLKQHKYWIRSEVSEFMCSQLGIQADLQGYYRDVRLWLPDEQFGIDPVCPSCKSNKRIGVHGYHKKTIARKVLDLNASYYLMSRRYICHTCKNDNASEEDQYTFMGYDHESVKLLPRKLSYEFPAFFTRKHAMDMKIVDLMRPLRDANVRLERFHDVVEELHCIEHCRQAILHEHSRDEKVHLSEKEKERFSTFHDKDRYAGFVPNRKWFQRVYLKNHKYIRPHMDNDQKRRSIEVAYVDVSYKGAKKIFRFGGEKLVDGLVTLKNNNNETRSQWFVPSDARDNYERPIREMQNTLEQYGMEGPGHIYVDNPLQCSFWLEMLPSLRRKEDEYDEMYRKELERIEKGEVPVQTNLDMEGGRIEDAVTTNQYQAECNFDLWFNSNCTYLSEMDAINASADALIEVLQLEDDDKENAVVIGLDGEWEVPTNSRGNVVGPPKYISLIQIAYHDEGGIKCVLYHLKQGKKLPSRLVDLLQNRRLHFAGCHVGGDISKINRDWGTCISKDENNRIHNLAGMALSRGVCLSGNGLDSVAPAVIKKDCPKDSQIEAWGWKANYSLPPHLQKYAAKDALFSLQIYDNLASMIDLTISPRPEDIGPGMLVDLAPYYTANMNIFNCGCTGALARIAEDQTSWRVPENLSIQPNVAKALEQGHYLVELLDVKAPAMKVKGIKIKGTNRYATLGEIGENTMVMIPLEMLRKHHEARAILAVDSSDQQHVIQRRRMAARSSQYINERADTIEIDQVFNDDYEVDDNEVLHNRDDRTSNDDYEEDEQNNNSDESNSNESTNDDSMANDFDLCLSTVMEIADVEKCFELAKKYSMALPGQTSTWTQKDGVHLDNPPGRIVDRYRAILGSGFHALHRIIVSSKHSHKKLLFVALSEALFAWDKDEMDNVCSALKDDLGLDEKEIIIYRYFRRRYFAKRVRRHCLPPSRLYWRVRAVFEVYGLKVDRETGKALFNKVAWKKANGVLKEIIQGHYSDPPGIPMYKFKLTPAGDIKRDQFGIALLKCDRDTNALEGSHAHINHTLGTQMMGPEMVDAVLAEDRLRSNIKASRANRLNFPKFGHYNTWMIDIHQKVVERNHNELLYPGWVCASDYAPTNEKFGFVCLAPKELEDQINNEIDLDEIAKKKMTPTTRYLSDAVGCKVHPRPWSTVYECKTVYPIVLMIAQRKYQNNMTMIDKEMCSLILRYVDGITVFPKIESYNRLYRNKRKHRANVREASHQMLSEGALLAAMNRLTEHSTGQEEVQTATEPMQFDAGISGNDEDGESLSPIRRQTFNNFAKTNFGCIPFMPQPAMPIGMHPIHPGNFIPYMNPVFVGIHPISLQGLGDISIQGPRHIRPLPNQPRGNDVLRRQQRKCRNCNRTSDAGCNGGRSGPLPRGQHQRWCDAFEMYFGKHHT